MLLRFRWNNVEESFRGLFNGRGRNYFDVFDMGMGLNLCLELAEPYINPKHPKPLNLKHS